MPLPFTITAVLTLASAVAAISLRNLVHCALCLIVTFAGLAALFLQLNAQFVGFAQVLVYIGAVAILILFAILLTRSSEMRTNGARTVSASWWIGVAVALATFGTLVLAVSSSKLLQTSLPKPPAVTVHLIGTELM